MRRLVFLGVAALVLCACSDSAPKPDERLVVAYVEMRVAEQTYGGESSESRIARRDILKKYGYTREGFVEACDKVLDDEKRWISFQTAVAERVDSLLGIPKPKPAKKDKK